jgi:hypothetical protein
MLFHLNQILTQTANFIKIKEAIFYFKQGIMTISLPHGKIPTLPVYKNTASYKQHRNKTPITIFKVLKLISLSMALCLKQRCDLQI